MKINWKIMILWMALCTPLLIEKALADENYSLQLSAQTSRTVFDFRDGNLESALVHARLISLTYDEMHDLGLKPDFAVVFMDSSVLLLSHDRDKFTSAEKKILIELDKAITEIASRGIRLEVCLYAVNYFSVDPKSIPRQIKQVKNGWIASSFYQADRFSLVPVF